MLPAILLLDDEPQILQALTRLLRDSYQVNAFTDAREALAFFQQTPTPIVITDIRMPEVDGISFLKAIVEINPRCRRVVLTGYLDAEVAQQAINQGQISCYLTKPWDNQELKSLLKQQLQALALESKKNKTLKQLKINNQQLSAKHKAMTQAIGNIQSKQTNTNDKLEQLTLANEQLIKFSADLIALQSEDHTGHSVRVAHQAKALARRFDLDDELVSQIYLAGLLYRVGITSLPAEILPLNVEQLTTAQAHEWQKFPQISATILSETELFKPCAELVKHLFEHIDGSGNPDHLAKRAIPFGARILALVIHYDMLIQGTINGRVLPPSEAQVLIEPLIGKTFQREVYQQFLTMLEKPSEHEDFEVPVAVNQLSPNMVLAQDIQTHYQKKLLAEGCTLQTSQIETLQNYQQRLNKSLVAYVRSESLANAENVAQVK